MCPHCGQNSPIEYRGALAFCAGCGKPRPPPSGTSINLKGKPAKIGGAVAFVLGWVLLVLGGATAVIVGALLQALLPPAGWFVGGAIGFVVLAASLVLLLGGRTLRRSGVNAARLAQRDALNSLAEHNRGLVTIETASRSLGVTLNEAEAQLVALAKEPGDDVTLEVDDNGKLYYRFARFASPPRWPADVPVRVDTKDATSAIEAETAEPSTGTRRASN
jgi:hypothetical protein